MIKESPLEIVIEGAFGTPEAGSDLSAVWTAENDALKRIERGIPLVKFSEDIKKRKLEIEFKLVKRLTETVHHSSKQVEYNIVHNQLNRYKGVVPCIILHNWLCSCVSAVDKDTLVTLPITDPTEEDPKDSYIHANYLNVITLVLL